MGPCIQEAFASDNFSTPFHSPFLPLSIRHTRLAVFLPGRPHELSQQSAAPADFPAELLQFRPTRSGILGSSPAHPYVPQTPTLRRVSILPDLRSDTTALL